MRFLFSGSVRYSIDTAQTDRKWVRVSHSEFRDDDGEIVKIITDGTHHGITGDRIYLGFGHWNHQRVVDDLRRTAAMLKIEIVDLTQLPVKV